MTQSVDIGKINTSIEMIKKYVKECNVEPLISVLEKLKQEPDNESLIEILSDEINKIGVTKGAVLTYAPYVISLLSEDLFASY